MYTFFSCYCEHHSSSNISIVRSTALNNSVSLSNSPLSLCNCSLIYIVTNDKLDDVNFILLPLLLLLKTLAYLMTCVCSIALSSVSVVTYFVPTTLTLYFFITSLSLLLYGSFV